MAEDSKSPRWKQFANAIFSPHVASARPPPSGDVDRLEPGAQLAAASDVVALGARVAAIYARTPFAVLSIERVAKMLGVSERMSADVMTMLVRQRLLRCTGRGEFVLR